MFGKYAERAMLARLHEYEVRELVNEDGTHPALLVEKLDASNATFLEEQILRAGEAVAELSREQHFEKSRDTIARHAVRRLIRVYRDDGTPADDADVAAFVRAIPLVAFLRLSNFCMAADAADEPASRPAELAKKS